MQVISKARWLAAIAATLWFASATTYASDHLDNAAVIADPASDIGVICTRGHRATENNSIS